MEVLFLFFILLIFVIAWGLDRFKGTGMFYRTSQHHFHDIPSDERLPSGYTRSDYKNYGFTDFDIEFLGLDQPGAPDPLIAGWMIWDMADGELDGEIDF